MSKLKEDRHQLPLFDGVTLARVECPVESPVERPPPLSVQLKDIIEEAQSALLTELKDCLEKSKKLIPFERLRNRIDGLFSRIDSFEFPEDKAVFDLQKSISGTAIHHRWEWGTLLSNFGEARALSKLSRLLSADKIEDFFATTCKEMAEAGGLDEVEYTQGRVGTKCADRLFRSRESTAHLALEIAMGKLCCVAGIADNSVRQLGALPQLILQDSELNDKFQRAFVAVRERIKNEGVQLSLNPSWRSKDAFLR